jgi:hypothetical protein
VRSLQKLRGVAVALAILASSAPASAQQIVLDRGQAAGKYWVFPIAGDPHSYLYAVAQAHLARHPNGKPQFSFLRFVENVMSAGGSNSLVEATGGGIVHAVIELGVPEERRKEALADAQRALQQIDPGGKIVGTASYTSGQFMLITSFQEQDDSKGKGEKADKWVEKVVAFGEAPILEGGKAAISMRLTKDGAKILWQSFHTTTPDISFLFNMNVDGVKAPVQAKLKVNWERAYSNEKIQVGVAAPMTQIDIDLAFEELRQQGAISLTEIGDDAEMHKTVTDAYEKVRDLMFDKTNGLVAQKPGSAGAGTGKTPSERAEALRSGRKGERETRASHYKAEADAQQSRADAARKSADEWAAKAAQLRAKVDATVAATAAGEVAAREANADVAKPEAAKPEAAKPEAAKPEAAKPEAAKPEAAKTEVAKADATKTDAAKTDATKADAAKGNTAKADTAKTTTETKVDTAKTDSSKADPAKKDSTKADAAKGDQTKTDAVKADATKADAAKKEEEKKKAEDAKKSQDAEMAKMSPAEQLAYAETQAVLLGKVADQEEKKLAELRKKQKEAEATVDDAVQDEFALAFSYSLKKERQTLALDFDFNKYRSASRKLRFDENIGDLHRYVDDDTVFRSINLDDPMYKQREIPVALDGTNQEDFKKYINYVTVQLRKKHENGDETIQDVRIDRENLSTSLNNYRLLYGWKGDNDRAAWFAYRYRVFWSFFGGGTAQGDWIDSTEGAIPIVSPYTRREIELDGDAEELESANVRAVVFTLYYKLGGVERTEKLTLKPGKSVLNTKVAYIRPVGDDDFDYEMLWVLKGNKTVTSGRQHSTSEYLLVDMPAKESET